LDYGHKRIGVSISDPLRITAQPLDTWTGLGPTALVQKLRIVVAKESVDTIVVGLPLTLGGRKGRLAESVERVAERIRADIPVAVRLWDERLSSVQAERILRQQNRHPSRCKSTVDRLAAVLVLQSYLDYLGSPAFRKPEGPVEPS
jgi:putative Holliday junction resolvase